MNADYRPDNSSKRGRWNRRRFLKWSAAPVAAAVAGGGYFALRKPIRLALIGAGGRGRQLARAMRWTAVQPVYGQVVAVCDVNRQRAEQVQAESCPAAEVYSSYRRVLERDDVRGVLIATPDHWHAALALAALNAGKAVYCEKPLTLTVEEGQRLVDAVRKTQGVLLVGTQQRSSRRFQQACELVRSGRLGRLRRVEVWLPSGSLPREASGGPFGVCRRRLIWTGTSGWARPPGRSSASNATTHSAGGTSTAAVS